MTGHSSRSGVYLNVYDVRISATVTMHASEGKNLSTASLYINNYLGAWAGNHSVPINLTLVRSPSTTSLHPVALFQASAKQASLLAMNRRIFFSPWPHSILHSFFRSAPKKVMEVTFLAVPHTETAFVMQTDFS